MAPRKRPRKNICAVTPAPEIAALLSLPADLILEIMARTNLFTLVRCAAACKHLRRDILSPSFICHVTKHAAPSILAYLSIYDDWALTLVHPVTPAAESFCHDHLSPFMSCRLASLLGQYCPVTSRGGLIVLRHQHVETPQKYKKRFDLGVYNPMTGHTAFLPKSPYVCVSITSILEYVMLTAADGIGCTFMLLFIDLNMWSIKVHTATSSSRTWETVTYANHCDSPWQSFHGDNSPTILRGGIVHWLVEQTKQIITYDVRTRMSGLLRFPPINGKTSQQLHLVTSPDKNLLTLCAIDGFMISMWLQLPTTPTGGVGFGGGDGWALETVINIEEKLRSLYPDLPVGDGPDVLAEFKESEKRTDDMVLLQICSGYSVVLDLETKEIHRQEWGSMLLEIDLPSHLESMKVFS